MPTKQRVKVQVPIPADLPPALVIETLQSFEPLLDNHYYIQKYELKRAPINRKDLAVIRGDPLFRQDCGDLQSGYVSPASNSSYSITTVDSWNPRWRLYDIWEDVYWVPFIIPYFSRLKRFLAVGCKTESGIRYRTTTALGVISRGAFTVVERATGRPYADSGENDVRESTKGDDFWDGDTEKGSIADGETACEGEGEGVSESSPDQSETDGERTEGKDADETVTLAEPTWSLVCDCEVESSRLLIPLMWRSYRQHHEHCEHLCQAIIDDTITESQYGSDYSSSDYSS